MSDADENSVHSSDEDQGPEEDVQDDEQLGGQVQQMTAMFAGLARAENDGEPIQQDDGGGSEALEGRLRELPELVADVMSEDASRQLHGTTMIRKLLSIERHPPINAVIETGVVPRLVQLLTAVSPQIQFEAAWALTNVASGTSEHTRIIAESGAVPIFIQLLSSPNTDVGEQAIWALGNIAGDSPRFRDFVIDSGMMAPLLTILASEGQKVSVLRNGTWALSNLVRGKPQPEFHKVRDCLPTLSRLIFSADDEVLTDACWAVSYLSDGPNDRIQAVIEAGLVRRLVELLMHPSPSVQTPALRSVGNIVTGDDVQTQTVLNAGAVPCLLALLASQKKGIRKEACWALSNILSGNRDQIQAVIDGGCVPALISLLENAEFDIRKEAAWCLSNLCAGGSDDQIRYAVAQNCIPPMCALLTVPDAKILTVALEGLEIILRVGQREAEARGGGQNPYATAIEECGGLDSIEQAQQHDRQEVYEKAVDILQRFFEGEVEEGERDRGDEGRVRANDEGDEEGSDDGNEQQPQQQGFGVFAFGGNF